MSAIPTKLKELLSRTNHGWTAIWLQSAAALFFVFGVVCVIKMEPGVFAFGAVFASAQLLIRDDYLALVGWSSVTVGIFLFAITLPSSLRQLARAKKDQAMLQRQDWKK